jgi:hypothetical protein
MKWGKVSDQLQKGRKAFRTGWNGSGMFVVYQRGYPDGIPCNAQTAQAWGLTEGDLFKCRPYFQIKNVDGSHSMWVPSIGDLLADDWQLIEEGASKAEYDNTFGESLQAMTAGRRVSRPKWGGYWQMEVVAGFTYPLIVAHTADGSTVPATPYQEDILAEDWIILADNKEVQQ